MLVVGDLDEVFVPSLDLLVNPAEKRAQIETLLDRIPDQFAESVNVDSALGSAIRGGLATLVNNEIHTYSIFTHSDTVKRQVVEATLFSSSHRYQPSGPAHSRIPLHPKTVCTTLTKKRRSTPRAIRRGYR